MTVVYKGFDVVAVWGCLGTVLFMALKHANPSGSQYVIVIPLETDKVDGEVLAKRFEVGYLLYRAVFFEATRRLTLVRESKAWQRAKRMPHTTPEETKARNNALNEARLVYDLDERGLRDWVKEARNSSKWMLDHIDSQTAALLSVRVWQSFEDHLMRGKGKPKPPKRRDFNTLEGVPRNAKNGSWQSITIRGTFGGKSQVKAPGDSWDKYEGPLVLVWNAKTGKSREIAITLKTKESTPQTGRAYQYQAHALENPAAWRGVKLVRRETVVGSQLRHRYEAHLTIDGTPWRSESYQPKETTDVGVRVGLDLGVSSLACVAATDEGIQAALLVKAAPKDLARQEKQAKKRRRTARALERSRRNTNPTSFKRGKKGKEAAGARIPGSKLDYSVNYRKLSVKQKQQANAAARERARRIRETATQIVTELGTSLYAEDVSVRQWMSLWGKAIGSFAPSTLMKAIEEEAERHGGNLTPFPTKTTALSQTCLCGAKRKKPLSQRKHTCDCPTLKGEEIHRDLFSAYLATNLHQTPKTPPTNEKTPAKDKPGVDNPPKKTPKKPARKSRKKEEPADSTGPELVWTLNTSQAAHVWKAKDARICLREAVFKVNVTQQVTTPTTHVAGSGKRVASNLESTTNTPEDVPTPAPRAGSGEGGGKVDSHKRNFSVNHDTTQASKPKNPIKHRR